MRLKSFDLSFFKADLQKHGYRLAACFQFSLKPFFRNICFLDLI